MKLVLILCLFTLWNCSILKQNPYTHIAEDSMSFGKVQVLARKITRNEDVCFEIEMKLKNVDQKEILPSNWTVAWIDQSSNYHLLRLNQRDPASIPTVKKSYTFFRRQKEWSNDFVTCAPKAKVLDVNALVLNPKSLPYSHAGGITLKWK